MKTRTTEERFWSHVDKNGPIPLHRPDLGACWLWTGHRLPKGYGMFYLELVNGKKKFTYAHRFSFELHIGPLDGEQSCHLCDNPPCCNPAHLFRGNQSANLRDSALKGRLTGNRRLSEGQIRSILLYKKNGWSHRKIADHFLIHRDYVSDIWRGKTWAHVE
jgi:HNH endonuclease